MGEISRLRQPCLRVMPKLKIASFIVILFVVAAQNSERETVYLWAQLACNRLFADVLWPPPSESVVCFGRIHICRAPRTAKRKPDYGYKFAQNRRNTQ